MNGQKTWCSGAQHAQFGILIARTDPKAPKHQGITYFLLEMKAPGIEVRPLVEMTGEARFNEVFLYDVRVPDSARLGAVGQGWAITQTTLLHERMSMSGLSSLLDLEALRAFVKEQVGTPDPLLRDELAGVYTELKCLQLLNARVVTKLGRGQMPTAESSVMKLALARVMTRAAEAAMKAMGPRGLCAAASGRTSSCSHRPGTLPAAATRCRRTCAPSACSVCRAIRTTRRTCPSTSYRGAGTHGRSRRDRREGRHVLVVTLNRPEKQNAVNCEVMCRLYDAWLQLDRTTISASAS